MRQFVELAQGRLGFARQDRTGQRQNLAARRQSEHREHVRLGDFLAAKADQLVQRRFRVAHAAVSPARDGVQRGVIDLDVFLFRDLSQVLDNKRRGNAPQIKALAAGKDGGDDLFRFGGGEHEFDVRRRFFQRLEQRVERLLGQHVNFVNNINLEARGGRDVLDRLAQFADLVDAAIAGAVDFQHVHRAAFGDFHGARIVVGEIDLGAVGAIEAFGKNSGDGGLARAARADEKVGVGDALLREWHWPASG